jgi:hypothetical protein
LVWYITHYHKKIEDLNETIWELACTRVSTILREKMLYKEKSVRQDFIDWRKKREQRKIKLAIRNNDTISWENARRSSSRNDLERDKKTKSLRYMLYHLANTHAVYYKEKKKGRQKMG